MAQNKTIDITSFPRVDKNSFVPLYVQISEKFEELIYSAHGQLAGAALPSEVECMNYFGVSRPTVRQAMAQLISQNLITRGRGRGTFIAPERIDHDLSRAFEDEMRMAKRLVRFTLIDRSIELASPAVCKALQLEEGTEVELIRRLRILEDAVFGYEERYVPAEYSASITKSALETQAIYSLIHEFANEPPASFSLTTRSIAASKESAAMLGTKAGTPLLSSEHIYFLEAGLPVLYGIVLFRGDRYQFTISTQIRSGNG
jgi:GntR family transcriptional regulator